MAAEGQPLRVAATAIILDNTKLSRKKLEKLFDSTEAVGTTDYFIALDTKSSVDSESYIKGRLGDKAMVIPYTFEKHFSKARNIVTELVQRYAGTIPWFYWIDSDDVIVAKGGKSLQEMIQKTIPDDVNSVWAEYLYEQDEYGNPSTTLVRKRFLRNSAHWVWKGRIHEDVFEDNEVHGQIAQTPDFQWVHDSEGRVPTSRNFELLDLAIAEEPNEPRNYYYLGNQHFAMRDWPQAVSAYEKYLNLSQWKEERWCALIYQAICYRAMQMLPEALASDTKAMHLKPEWADSYLGMGETYARMERYQEAKHFGELGLQMVADGRGIPDPIIFVNQNAYMHNPYQWLAVAYANLGDNKMALEALKMAAKARPEKETLLKIAHLTWAMEREEAIDAGIKLAMALVKRNEPLKAKAILENLPAGAAEQKALVVQAQANVAGRVKHLYNKTDYKNFYWSEQVESIDPIEELKHMAGYPRMDWVLRRLRAAGAKRVLELGVGNALSSLYYATNGIEIVGIDVDPRRVAEANQNAVKLGLLKKQYDKKRSVYVPLIEKASPVQFHFTPADDWDKAQAVLTDGTKINLFDLGPFDAVIATELIEHVLEPEKILEACERASKRVIISTPDGAFSGPQQINGGHVRMWSQNELAKDLMHRGRLVSLHKVAHPVFAEQSNLVAEYVTGQTYDGPNAIIYTFDTGQGWSPDSIREGGVGGSETAVIRVAEELTKRGMRVHVFGEAEGIWNGVRYSRTENFRPYPCQLFVSWRGAGPILQMKDVAAHRWMWAHDVTLGKVTDEQLEGTKIIALTNWHKEHLQGQYPKADIFVAGNGIDPSRFVRSPKILRNLRRIVYAQSPDRGLDKILSWWPEVTEKYPLAELHVYYGFDMARRRYPQFIAAIEQKAKELKGVTLHGRAGQEDVAKALLASGVVLFPETTPEGQSFPETYCISAVEAQAAGCMTIGLNYAGLAETNKNTLVDNADDIKQELFSFWNKASVRRKATLLRTSTVEAETWARSQTWEKVADEWLQQLVAKDTP